MGLEEDLFNTLKYASFSGGVDPTRMVHALVRQVEIAMLSQMSARIHSRISQLQKEQTPSDDNMDPFKILGVDVNATKDEVRRAYREKARCIHPDIGGDSIEMAKLNAAYEAIRLYKGWSK